jgi:large subunit ribosomal protein L19
LFVFVDASALFKSSMFSLASRLFSTAARRAQAAAYPFSKSAIVPPMPSVPPPPRASVGKGIMEYLHKTLPTPEKQTMLADLFSRRSPNQLMPGSVVTVTLEHAPTTFTGVLISIRRRGMATSFVLRNVVQRTGVEMQFFVNSPHLKEIAVERLPRKGRMRRAKLFYLRTAPDKMSMLAAGRGR